VQKILMTNDEHLPLRDVVEAYQLRWQIEISHPDYSSSDSLYRGSQAA
jgi:hypothetical protein